MSDEESKVILLGGSSFLGLQSAQTLFYYFNIICTYNQSPCAKFYPEFDWFQINFLEEDNKIEKNLLRLIERTTANYIVNFAGISKPNDAKSNPKVSKKINESVNKIITKSCAETDTIPIFISSDHVFNGEEGPYSELDEPNPLKNSIYGQQKYNAEKIYQEMENYAIIRLSTTLGINLYFQKQNIYEKALSKLEKGEKITGAGNKIRTASHCFNVPFVINKIIEAFEEKRIEKGIFHVPGQLLSEYELLQQIARTNNFNTSLIEEITIDNDNYSYPLKLGLKSEQTQKVLHGKYLSLKEALELLNFDYQQ